MSTERFYQDFADHFEKIPFEETLIPLFEKHVKDPRGKTVLDVGSGPGAFALWMQQKGCQILCLDSSEEMIRRCLQKGLMSQLISFQDYKAEEKFDLITMISSLIHLPKKEWAFELHHLSELLKSEGVLFLSVILGDFEGDLDPVGSGVDRFFCFIPEDEFQTLIDVDFHLVESRKVFISKMNAEFLIAVLRKK